MTTLMIMENAKKAWPSLATCDMETRTSALYEMAASLEKAIPQILRENSLDLESAKGKISEVMLDRLSLTTDRIKAMAEGIREVASLPDAIGRVIKKEVRDNGLVIEKTRVPMGVVAIIFESRPNVTSDAAALCIKAGNACILRAGKEAFRSANAIVLALQTGITKAGLPKELVQLIQDTTHASANELMTGVGYIDLLIPRGGAGLIKACTENAKVPCIHTGTGICHIYVDESADLQMALNIIDNAKTSRPSVCNAAEVCLVNEKIADEFLPMLYQRLVSDKMKSGLHTVALHLDEKSSKIIDGVKAGENDFDTEFLDYVMAIKVVKDVNEAVEHISIHSTHHSEAIISENQDSIKTFTSGIDSAAVYVNASTRFTDGGEFGLGCEMGISTQKLHARGPMGIEELMTYKYIIYGKGQIR